MWGDVSKSARREIRRVIRDRGQEKYSLDGKSAQKVGKTHKHRVCIANSLSAMVDSHTINTQENKHVRRSKARWVEPGCPPGAHQNHSITSLLSRTAERKYSERLVSQIRRVRSLTNYHPGQNRLDSGKLIYCQQNQSSTARKRKLNLKNSFSPPLPSFWIWLPSRFLYVLHPISIVG